MSIFYKIGIAEAVSLLVLLFMAMPLKYVYGRPEYVRWVGLIHGVLFVVYVAMSVQLKFSKNWKKVTLFYAVFLSVFPFGPILFHRKFLNDKDEETR